MKQIGIILILGSVLFALQLFAFTEPTASPPSNNTPTPLNMGSQGQSKSGGLILNTGGAAYGLIIDQGSVGIGTSNPTQKLDVAGQVKGTGFCIGNDCKTAWWTATLCTYATKTYSTGAVCHFAFSEGHCRYACASDGSWTNTGCAFAGPPPAPICGQ